MSGSGGGGGGGGGGGPEIDVVPNCDIVEKTQLNSPKAVSVAHIKVNDVLAVKLLTDGGQPLLIAETSTGERAGSLTPTHLAELIRCIRTGHTYIAVVLRVLGGIVQVEVRPSGTAA
jgi:hypothetical protein